MRCYSAQVDEALRRAFPGLPVMGGLRDRCRMRNRVWPRQLGAVVLMDQYHLSVDEVAYICGIHRGTVENCKRRVADAVSVSEKDREDVARVLRHLAVVRREEVAS